MGEKIYLSRWDPFGADFAGKPDMPRKAPRKAAGERLEFCYLESSIAQSVRSLIDEQVTEAESEYHCNLAPWIRKGLRGEPRSERPATGMGSRTSDYHDSLADFYRGITTA